MSFLDSLENSLKNLEGREERSADEGQRRHGDRSRALATAPWAERLRSSPWTNQLFENAAVAGHRIRAKIYMAWVQSVLRLEVRGRTLELRPTPNGIVADYTTLAGEEKHEAVDLSGNPDELLSKWLAGEVPPTPRTSPPDEEEGQA